MSHPEPDWSRHRPGFCSHCNTINKLNTYHTEQFLKAFLESNFHMLMKVYFESVPMFLRNNTGSDYGVALKRRQPIIWISDELLHLTYPFSGSRSGEMTTSSLGEVATDWHTVHFHWKSSSSWRAMYSSVVTPVNEKNASCQTRMIGTLCQKQTIWQCILQTYSDGRFNMVVHCIHFYFNKSHKSDVWPLTKKNIWTIKH